MRLAKSLLAASAAISLVATPVLAASSPRSQGAAMSAGYGASGSAPYGAGRFGPGRHGRYGLFGSHISAGALAAFVAAFFAALAAGGVFNGDDDAPHSP
jgi:hypothetical protein